MRTDTLPRHREWDKKYKYVDSHGVCYGSEFVYDSRLHRTWGSLRYALESNNGTLRNHHTFLTASTIDGSAILGDDELPHTICIRRHPMPPGFRQFQPASVLPRFIVAEAEAKTCETILEESSRAFLTDDANFEEHNRVYAETLERLKSLKDAMRSMRDKQGLHASELQWKTSICDNGDVITQKKLFVPPESYTCTLCFKKGVHFREDCDKTESEELKLVWGAQKKFTDLRAKTDPGCLSRK